jgi:hypothetical protein
MTWPPVTHQDVEDAVTALQAVQSQPLDSDLTAIAALSTTAFGRALLALVDAAAARAALGLGSAATAATGAFDAAGAATAAQAASQPLDSDLTAIAALATTAYGRGLLTQADAAAGRTNLGLGALAVKGAIAVATDITATGTPSATTYLRGDGSWSTPAGGSSSGSGIIPATGRYYTGPMSVYSTFTPTLNVLYAFPLSFLSSCTLVEMATKLWATGAAGSVVRMGIYGDTGGLPGTLLVDAGSANATVQILALTISQAITAGRVWLCAVAQVAAPQFERLSGGTEIAIGHTAAWNETTAGSTAYNTAATVSGVLPGTFPAIAGVTINAPMISVKVS